jgi:hypothetical protein
MRVNIDKAGRKRSPVSLYHLPRAGRRQIPERADEAGVDGNIGLVRVAAATVHYVHISDKAVKIRHSAPFLFRYTPSFSAGEKSV